MQLRLLVLLLLSPPYPSPSPPSKARFVIETLNSRLAEAEASVLCAVGGGTALEFLAGKGGVRDFMFQAAIRDLEDVPDELITQVCTLDTNLASNLKMRLLSPTAPCCRCLTNYA